MNKNEKYYSDAAVLYSPLDIRIEKKEINSLKEFEVLIKVEAVGICGSDIHYYEHGKIGTKKVGQPIILGHELSGVVEKVGERVTKFTSGERVVVEPGISCGKCQYCKKGFYNLCEKMEFLSSPPIDGAFTQYIKHEESFIYKIPDNLSFEVATLIEPLSVGLHALKKSNVQPGSNLLISGMGPVGLMAIIAARSIGVNNIIVTDVENTRLNIAKKLGADYEVNVIEEDLKEKIMHMSEFKNIDAILDTSGNEKAINLGIEILKKNGKISAIGFPKNEFLNINYYGLMQKEISLHGIYRYTNTFEHGVQILSKFKFDSDLIITDFFNLDETSRALDFVMLNKGKCIKGIIYPHKRMEE